MSGRELTRLEVMQRLESKRLRQQDAALQLGLTARQVRRLQAMYRAQGACGLVSRRRGKVSNNRLSGELQGEVLALLTTRYSGFGPTLAPVRFLSSTRARSCSTRFTIARQPRRRLSQQKRLIRL